MSEQKDRPVTFDDVHGTLSFVLPANLPETIEINGVTYARQADWVDQRVNEINAYEEISRRTDLSVRQVIWFCHADRSGVMPD